MEKEYEYEIGYAVKIIRVFNSLLISRYYLLDYIPYGILTIAIS